jgi:GNAT superfamily N-acetyltransferase
MMVSANDDPRRAGTIWMLDLDETTPAVVPRIKTEFCLAEANLAPALASIRELEAGRQAAQQARAEFEQRYRTGRRCYTAWVEGQIAAYGWISFDDERIGELNLRIRLLPGEAYIWDCFTASQYRGNHLYSALLAYILLELRAEGWQRAWIGADLDNLASQKGIARAGFHHLANLVVERVLALRQVWVEGLPGVPDHLVSEARRAFLGNRDEVWLTAPLAALQRG